MDTRRANRRLAQAVHDRDLAVIQEMVATDVDLNREYRSPSYGKGTCLEHCLSAEFEEGVHALLDVAPGRIVIRQGDWTSMVHYNYPEAFEKAMRHGQTPRVVMRDCLLFSLLLPDNPDPVAWIERILRAHGEPFVPDSDEVREVVALGFKRRLGPKSDADSVPIFSDDFVGASRLILGEEKMTPASGIRNTIYWSSLLMALRNGLEVGDMTETLTSPRFYGWLDEVGFPLQDLSDYMSERPHNEFEQHWLSAYKRHQLDLAVPSSSPVRNSLRL